MCYHIGLVYNLLIGIESSCKLYGFYIYMNRYMYKLEKLYHVTCELTYAHTLVIKSTHEYKVHGPSNLYS